MRTALIFGVTGQDGSYLAELLLSKGYRVVGVSRRVSVPTDQRIRHLGTNDNFTLVEGDVTDSGCVTWLIHQWWPNEIYNLAAQSHVKTSFEQPSLTTDVAYRGCLNILEALRVLLDYENPPRFYQASSSEMFGTAWSMWVPVEMLDDERVELSRLPQDSFERERAFQDESTPMLPCSPYAVAKLAAHHLVRVYRESYGLFACSGILFNHESERRAETFVTRKITKYVARWQQKRLMGETIPPLKLGNLDAKRDWGHAEDYVRGMWLMLQQEKPDDYVLATGQTHSVRDFLMAALAAVGYENERVVVVDPSLCRPCEVPLLRGDASKAKARLGWQPEVTFDQLVRRMVYHDLEEVSRGNGC